MTPLEAEVSDHHSGYVAVIGRPNVGKSTLFNRLLGQKIAITSPKPQTTRDQLLGIYTEENLQILFLDTPGIHRPEHKLGEHMVEVATKTILDADIVLWLVDAGVKPTEEDIHIAEVLRKLHQKHSLKQIILGLNKTDQQRAKDTAEWRSEEYSELLAWWGESAQSAFTSHESRITNSQSPLLLCRFSARTGDGIPQLIETLRLALPVGPRYYAEDEVTDLHVRFIAEEMIREKALLLLQDEVPHSIAVEVDEFTERSETLTYISATIYVERPTQKAIVLGEGGRMIKKIGAAARKEIETMLETKVYLELWVKVWERWRTRPDLLQKLGYAPERKG
ncbi:MAG: GTPase Era [Caldilineaceae bacterium]